MARADTPAAAVHSYLEAFNRDDPQAMAEAFDPDGSILDGMPPHAASWAWAKGRPAA